MASPRVQLHRVATLEPAFLFGHAPRQVSTRAQNERKFSQWVGLPGGGRRYELEVLGKLGWRARYLKEVDQNEVTTKFWQEIYDQDGKLTEVHEKFPIDKGHQKV